MYYLIFACEIAIYSNTIPYSIYVWYFTKQYTVHGTKIRNSENPRFCSLELFQNSSKLWFACCVRYTNTIGILNAPTILNIITIVRQFYEKVRSCASLPLPKLCDAVSAILRTEKPKKITMELISSYDEEKFEKGELKVDALQENTDTVAADTSSEVSLCECKFSATKLDSLTLKL